MDDMDSELTKFEMRTQLSEENHQIKFKSGGRVCNLEKIDYFEYLGVTIIINTQENNEIYKRML